MRRERAVLALADGRVFEGEPLGARGEATGEVVFNTAMSGYQEILTDPSYKGQIVCMTYPHIGNTGVNPEDPESHRPWAEGFVVREASPVAASWRATASLDSYLREHGIVGIQGIDTRALTRHLRDRGAQEGVISTEELDQDRLVAKAKASPGLIGRDLVQDVSCRTAYEWKESVWRRGEGYGRLAQPLQGRLARLDDATRRHHWDQPRHAQLHRLLDQPALTLSLGQSDAKRQRDRQLAINFASRRNGQLDLATADPLHAGVELRPTAIEQHDLLARPPPQHVRQVVRLGPRQHGA